MCKRLPAQRMMLVLCIGLSVMALFVIYTLVTIPPTIALTLAPAPQVIMTQQPTANNKGEIDLSLLCSVGDGTPSNPWIITEAVFYDAITLLSDTIRSIYLRTGYYHSSTPINIDFATVLSSNSNIWNGVRIYGRYSYWKFAPNNSKKPSLHIQWTNHDLFYWEITGIQINGNAMYELVKIGCDDINSCPLNSFVIDLIISNDYHSGSGTAIGIRLIRILQSKIKLIATCVQGTALYLDNAQFNDIFGSFSNGLTSDKKSIFMNGICLFLLNPTSNVFSSINLENCYDGIYFVDYSRGNVFNSLISNNEDDRGYVIRLVNPKFVDITEIIEYLVIRTSIQSNDSYRSFPKLWENDYSQHIKIMYISQNQ
eukprot:267121_1